MTQLPLTFTDTHTDDDAQVSVFDAIADTEED